MLSVKNDITGIIKEITVIMVKCQIRDLRDIKLKVYMIKYNIYKMICKGNNEEGLKCNKANFRPNSAKTNIVF